MYRFILKYNQISEKIQYYENAIAYRHITKDASMKTDRY